MAAQSAIGAEAIGVGKGEVEQADGERDPEHAPGGGRAPAGAGKRAFGLAGGEETPECRASCHCR